MLLMIDNYDSFTYNLVQYLGELQVEVQVARNDRITLAEVERLAPRYIVISPGPGAPDGAGISLAVVRAFAGRIPLLGVCLGHQSIAAAFGGRIVHAPEVMHGKPSRVHHDGRGVFEGLPQPFQAIRYHSLVVQPESLPACLEVCAWVCDARGRPAEIMGLRHRTLALAGVQFHPESIFTEHGRELLANFLRNGGIAQAPGAGQAARRASG